MPPVPTGTPPSVYSPSQSYAPPPRRFPVWAIVLITGCCCAPLLGVPILAAILFPVFAQARARVRERVCMNNIKRALEATRLYAEDHKGQLPSGKVWMDSITPYISKRERSPLHCPQAAPYGQGDWQNEYGYAFDSRVSQRFLASIKDPGATQAIYDSTHLSRNATDSGASIAYRHIQRASIGYLDGHVTSKRSNGEQAP